MPRVEHAPNGLFVGAEKFGELGVGETAVPKRKGKRGLGGCSGRYCYQPFSVFPGARYRDAVHSVHASSDSFFKCILSLEQGFRFVPT